MKRFLAVLFTTLLLSTALGATASASNFDSVAGELSDIGMFRGTDNGFELDRAPTRAEAGIMLVRLYGAEEVAASAYAAGDIHHPFTDVPEFAAPYIAWLYEQGLTNGTSPTTYSASENCTAENFLAFLVRSLGYQDGTDFQYANVAAFAEEKGLFDTSILTGTFLRDDLAALTYQALSCDLKDGSTYLLNSLIQDGAINADAAQKITDKIETYRLLLDASAEMDKALDVGLAVKADLSMRVHGSSNGQTIDESHAMPMDLTGHIQMILDKSPQMAITMAGTADGESMDSSVWLKDGWMYTQTAGESVKINLGNEIEDVMGSYEDMLSTNQLSSMLPFLESITTSTVDQNTVYTLTLNDAFAGFMDSIVELVMGSIGDTTLEGLDMGIHLDKCSYTYTLDNNGHIKDISAALAMAMEFAMNINPQNNITVNADIDMDMTMTVNAVGSDVTIEYPDFSGFEDRTAA